MDEIKKVVNAVLVKMVSHKPEKKIVLERYVDGTYGAWFVDEKAGTREPVDPDTLKGIEWNFGNVRAPDGHGWIHYPMQSSSSNRLAPGYLDAFNELDDDATQSASVPPPR